MSDGWLTLLRTHFSSFRLQARGCLWLLHDHRLIEPAILIGWVNPSFILNYCVLWHTKIIRRRSLLIISLRYVLMQFCPCLAHNLTCCISVRQVIPWVLSTTAPWIWLFPFQHVTVLFLNFTCQSISTDHNLPTWCLNRCKGIQGILILCAKHCDSITCSTWWFRHSHIIAIWDRTAIKRLLRWVAWLFGCLTEEGACCPSWKNLTRLLSCVITI